MPKCGNRGGDNDLELLPGDLILVRGDGIVANAIEEVTDCPYSHVAGVCHDTTLIEAQGFRRTGYVDASAYAGCADVYRFKYPLPIKARNRIVSVARAGVGGRYDYALILWELVRYALGVVLPHRKTSKRVCSTFWTSAYRKAGIDLCKGVRYPSPADIAASPHLKRVGAL